MRAHSPDRAGYYSYSQPGSGCSQGKRVVPPVDLTWLEPLGESFGTYRSNLCCGNCLSAQPTNSSQQSTFSPIAHHCQPLSSLLALWSSESVARFFPLVWLCGRASQWPVSSITSATTASWCVTLKATYWIAPFFHNYKNPVHVGAGLGERSLLDTRIH